MDRGDQVARAAIPILPQTKEIDSKERIQRAIPRLKSRIPIELPIICVIGTIYAFLRLVSQISSGFPLFER